MTLNLNSVGTLSPSSTPSPRPAGASANSADDAHGLLSAGKLTDNGLLISSGDARDAGPDSGSSKVAGSRDVLAGGDMGGDATL